ncbi:MAG: D-tyrosyl-tRNA(Tyr) deacylase [Saccharofermentans sp.]|nr:D-tyrosyl-tRNA(Tyr) deacylase [Saccharofermentans sp.]
MRFVIQCVTEASVTIEGKVSGSIDKGYVVLAGVGEGDDEKIADKLIDKMLKLRIFKDENDKTNLNLEQVDGGILIVSQFTLYADCRKGNRPSFVNAMEPKRAEELYNYIVSELKSRCPDVQTGEFGADMKVSLVNDGPFTIVLDSKDLL